MQIKDYLLVSIGEEAGEVQQAVGKALRFGLLDVNPKLPNAATNWVQLRTEIHDIIAVYEMLCNEFDRVETLERDLIEAKKTKVLKWMQYADSLGRFKG